jgi:hypothetical protein
VSPRRMSPGSVMVDLLPGKAVTFMPFT